jgi:uncharacterized protein (DUF1800 family)
MCSRLANETLARELMEFITPGIGHIVNQDDFRLGTRTVFASVADSTLAREKYTGKYSPAAQGL